MNIKQIFIACIAIISFGLAMEPTQIESVRPIPVALDPDVWQRACTSLSKSSGSCLNLSHLRLAKDQLALLLRTLTTQECMQIRVCNLVACELYTLPDEIALLRGLCVLIVRDNMLFELPPTIGDLALLEVLDVSYNDLQYIPPCVGSLINLKEFHVCHNRIRSLPMELTQLQNLAIFSLEDNTIRGGEKFPFGRLKKLYKLYLSHSGLAYLHDSIEDLDELTYLQVTPASIISPSSSMLMTASIHGLIRHRMGKRHIIIDS